MRKKVFFITICTALLLAACESVEERAAKRLQLAQTAFDSGHYSEAKNEIDSIKILYPKAFETRKAAIGLMQEIELAEQQKSVQFYDSVLTVKQVAFEEMKKGFVLEKDKDYQDVGNYFSPAQLVEKRLGDTFLRAQVSELGEMSITSIYNGAKTLRHNAIKVSTGDVFVNSPVSNNVYSSTNLGRVTEKADYLLGSDGGLILFIAQNRDSKLKVELLGGKSCSYTLNKRDAVAIASLYELSLLLQSIQEAQTAKAEAEHHIAFINKVRSNSKQ